MPTVKWHKKLKQDSAYDVGLNVFGKLRSTGTARKGNVNGNENKATASCNIQIILCCFLWKDTLCVATETSLTADGIYCPLPVVIIIFSIRGVYMISLCICRCVLHECSHLHLAIPTSNVHNFAKLCELCKLSRFEVYRSLCKR
jgi:hypothetical protein